MYIRNGVQGEKEKHTLASEDRNDEDEDKGGNEDEERRGKRVVYCMQGWSPSP